MRPVRFTVVPLSVFLALSFGCRDGNEPDGPVPAQIEITPDPVTLRQKDSVQLVPVVLDETGALLTGVSVAFTSSNPTIVTVSRSGMVKSVGKAGTATVSAKAGRVVKNVPVTVVEQGRPQGTLAETVPVIGPWGVSISSGGVVYVTQPNTPGGIARANLPSTSFAQVINNNGQRMAQVAFNSAGTIAYVSGMPYGGVAIIDVASNSVVASITSGIQGVPLPLIISPDNQTLYLGTGDGYVHAIDVATRAVTKTLFIGGQVNSLTLHPTQPLLYASNERGGAVVEISTPALGQVRQFNIGGIPQDMAVAPDGSELYVALEGAGSLGIISLSSGAMISVPLGIAAFGLTMTPDRVQLYVVGSGALKIVDRVSRTVVSTISLGGVPRRIAFSADGGTAVITNESAGQVHIIR